MGASGGSSIGVTQNAWGRALGSRRLICLREIRWSHTRFTSWLGQDSYQQDPINKVSVCVCVWCFLGGSELVYRCSRLPLVSAAWASCYRNLKCSMCLGLSWWAARNCITGKQQKLFIIQKRCAWRWHERFKRMPCKDAVQIYAGSLSYSKYQHNRHSTTSFFPQMQYLFMIKGRLRWQP